MTVPWREQNVRHQYMFQGRSIYMFKGQLDNDAHFLFGTLVCFDWVAHIKGRRPFQWILADIHQRAGDAHLGALLADHLYDSDLMPPDLQ